MVLQALFISLAILSVTGLLISVYVLRTVRRFQGALLWSLGIFNLMSGSLLVGLRGIVPDMLSISLGNLLLISVPAVLAHSLRKFRGETGRPFVEYFTAFLFGGLFLAAFILGDLKSRIVVMSLAYGVLWIFPALQAEKSGRHLAGRGNILLAGTFLCMSLLSFARAAISAPADIGSVPYLSMKGFQEFYLFSGSALWFSALTGFILLINGRLERELRIESQRLSEANETKKRFLGLIGHDLRGSVGSLMNALEFLRDELAELDDPDSARKKRILDMARIAENQSRMTNEVLNNLLTWASYRQDKIVYDHQRLELGLLLRSQLDFLRPKTAEKGVKVTVLTAEINRIEIYADRDSAAALFRNLIANAVKYSHPGGTVEIDAARAGPSVRIRIADRGTGMSPERLREIREEHKVISNPGTGGETGTGMGLQLCFEYTRGNHGTIEFESQPGAGTTVTVTLPARPANHLLT